MGQGPATQVTHLGWNERPIFFQCYREKCECRTVSWLKFDPKQKTFMTSLSATFSSCQHNTHWWLGRECSVSPCAWNHSMLCFCIPSCKPYWFCTCFAGNVASGVQEWRNFLWSMNNVIIATHPYELAGKSVIRNTHCANDHAPQASAFALVFPKYVFYVPNPCILGTRPVLDLYHVKRMPLCTEKQAHASKYFNPLMLSSADSLVPEDKPGMALLVYWCRDDYKSFAVQLR